MDLHKACKALFALAPRQSRPPRSCEEKWMLLAVDARGGTVYYELTRAGGWCHRTYGLFPHGLHAGHGSFIGPDGEFTQHGQIDRAAFERIIAAAVPCSP